MKLAGLILFALFGWRSFGNPVPPNAELVSRQDDRVLGVRGTEAELLYAYLDTPEQAQAGYEGHENYLKQVGVVNCHKYVTYDFVGTPGSKPPSVTYHCRFAINPKGEVSIP